MLRELSVAEQRYQAVSPVIEDGLQVSEAAAKAVAGGEQVLLQPAGHMPVVLVEREADPRPLGSVNARDVY